MNLGQSAHRLTDQVHLEQWSSSSTHSGREPRGISVTGFFMGLMSFLSRNHQHQSTDVSTSGLALSTTKLPTKGALLMPNTTNYYHLYEKKHTQRWTVWKSSLHITALTEVHKRHQHPSIHIKNMLNLLGLYTVSMCTQQETNTNMWHNSKHCHNVNVFAMKLLQPHLIFFNLLQLQRSDLRAPKS